ncbi:MAG: hypothetical protein ABNH53_08995 [Henriciella sp.]
MSNAPPQAHPNRMLTATPKGWHYTRTQSGCALALYWALCTVTLAGGPIIDLAPNSRLCDDRP